MDCKQVEELVASYALGALSDEERREFEDHLGSCPDCLKLLGQFQAVAGLLPLTVRQRKPRARLKARLLAAAKDDLGAQAAQAQDETTRPAYRRLVPGFFPLPKPYVAMAALMLFAIIGLALWNVQLRSTNDERARELAQIKQSIQTFVARGTAAAPEATGRLVFLVDQDKSLLLVQGLPALPQDKAYQMWLIKDGAPTSAGLFQVTPSQEAVTVVAGDLGQFQVFAVTIEPVAGVPHPTGDIVLAAEL